MKCKICTHPDRKAINRQIAQGGSLRKIAQDRNLSYDSLYRHSRKHLSRQLQNAYSKKVEQESLDVLDELQWTLDEAKSMMQKAKQKGSLGIALTALQRIQNGLELLSKIEIALRRERREADDLGLELFADFNMSVFTQAELQLMDSIAVKRITAMSGVSSDGYAGPVYEAQEVTQASESAEEGNRDQEEVTEKPDQEETGGEKQGDNHINDLQVRPIPIITPFDPLQKSKNRMK